MCVYGYVLTLGLSIPIITIIAITITMVSLLLLQLPPDSLRLLLLPVLWCVFLGCPPELCCVFPVFLQNLAMLPSLPQAWHSTLFD